MDGILLEIRELINNTSFNERSDEVFLADIAKKAGLVTGQVGKLEWGFATTPERMALIAGAIGGGSALIGLWAAYSFDTPAGPSIVSVAAGLFLLANLTRGRRPA